MIWLFTTEVSGPLWEVSDLRWVFLLNFVIILDLSDISDYIELF